ncbi:MAG: hypothetical protein AB1595_03515 [bacterium]
MKKILVFLLVGVLVYATGTPTITGTKTVSPSDKSIGEYASFTYTIEYKNEGDGTATNVMIYDQIPEGMVYESGSAGTETLPATITYSSNGIDWQTKETNPVIYILWEIIGNIEPYGTGTVKFAVKKREE